MSPGRENLQGQLNISADATIQGEKNKKKTFEKKTNYSHEHLPTHKPSHDCNDFVLLGFFCTLKYTIRKIHGYKRHSN